METQCNYSLGAYAWPGDEALLRKYGVTIDTIADCLTKIFEEVKNQTEKRDENCISQTRHQIAGLKITARFHWGNTIRHTPPCRYCNESQPNIADYTITNPFSKVSITIHDAMLHLIKKHKDLGNGGSKYRATPTQLCKVLGLGNIELSPSDPLFEVAKFGFWSKEQIEQKKIDDKMMFNLNCTAEKIGIALKDLAIKAEELLRYKDFYNVFIGNYKIRWEGSFGYGPPCDLCDSYPTFNGYNGKIKRKGDDQDGDIVDFTMCSIHKLTEHGCFGMGDQRIEPQKIYKILYINTSK